MKKLILLMLILLSVAFFSYQKMEKTTQKKIQKELYSQSEKVKKSIEKKTFDKFPRKW